MPGGGEEEAARQLAKRLLRLPNGQFHFAIAFVLLASSLIGVAVPVSRGVGGGDQGVASSGALTVPHGASNALMAVADGPGGAEHDGTQRQRDEPVAFTLHENGLPSLRSTVQRDVAGALSSLGAVLHPRDIITPPGQTELTSGMHVYVRYAAQIELVMGNETRQVYTQAHTLADALAEEGIAVLPTDLLAPPADTEIRSGMRVYLTTIRDVVVTDEQPIAFATTNSYDSSAPEGQQAMARAGAPGVIRRDFRVQLVNGQEVSREFIAQTTVPPTDEVIAIGTFVAVTPAPAPAYVAPAASEAQVAPAPGGEECASRPFVHATYYTAASAGGTVTATGTGVYKGIIAVDPRYIPLGTRMYVPGYGYGVAADTGGGVKGWWIDVAYGADDYYDWTTRDIEICILA